MFGSLSLSVVKITLIRLHIAAHAPTRAHILHAGLFLATVALPAQALCCTVPLTAPPHPFHSPPHPSPTYTHTATGKMKDGVSSGLLSPSCRRASCCHLHHQTSVGMTRLGQTACVRASLCVYVCVCVSLLEVWRSS